MVNLSLEIEGPQDVEDGAPIGRGRLSVDQAAAYLRAGRAVVTVESLRTGVRFTYRVRRVEFDDKPGRPRWFVDLLAGPDNTGDYRYLGELNPETLTFRLTPRSAFPDDAPSIKALVATVALVRAGREHPQLAIWHEGRCGRCGRRLTVPSSIATGIGPVCAELMEEGR